MENVADKGTKRAVDLVVISDLHLGTYGCHAKELLEYLNSIKPKTVILNGDIVDIWQFSKRYWPDTHMKVLKKFTAWASKGIDVYYLTGNHDDMLRKFSDFSLGSFHLKDKLILNLNGKKTWFFHGDVFDISMKYSPMLAKLGGKAYDYLILFNRAINAILAWFGRDKISLSKKVKDSVKKAVKFINDFEDVIAAVAIEERYDYVVCGHIHQPQMREIKTAKGNVQYLNSGDWIENLTSLEFHNNNWKIYKHSLDFIKNNTEEAELIEQEELENIEINIEQLLSKL